MPNGTNTADIRAFLASDESLPESPFPDPLEQASLRQEQASVRRKNYPEAFSAENKVGEIPLDIESGAGWWDRARASFRSSPEQTVKFWQDLYGTQNVRPAMFQSKPTGGLIVRALDEVTQKPKDILVDEESFTAKDLADMAGTVPELAASIGAAIAAKRAVPLGGPGRARGIARTARDIISSGVGAETAGALKDITFRAIDEMPVEFGKVLEEHAKAVPRDTVFGALLAGAGKLTSKVITPFGAPRTAIAREGVEASEYFGQRFGEPVPLSTGQKTGVPMFQRTEEEMKRLPGGTSPSIDLREQQQTVFQRIMDRLRGLPPQATRAQRFGLPSEEEVGREAILEMQQHNLPYDIAIQNARRKLVSRSQQNIEDTISQATVPQRALYSDVVGARVRARVQGERDLFTEESQRLYNAARSLPGGEDRILIAPSLAKKATAYLEKELPGKEVITETPTGVLDPRGQMITRTTTGKEPLKEFIPSQVIGKLRELSQTGQTKWSLQDLIAMRNEVSNDIAVGEAVPGVQTHHLRKIRDMLTGAIKESTDAIPDKKLKNAWQAANDHYAENVGKFHTRLISSLLKEPNAPGFVGSEGLVDRILSNTDNILEARKFLGEKSPEYLLLKRSLADRLFEQSVIPGTKSLDGGSFLRKLSDLRSSNRRVFDELFGSFGDRLLLQAENVRVGQLAKLDSETVEKAVRQRYEHPRLAAWVDAEKAKDLAYQNEVRKWIGSGKVPGDLQPGEFVSRFLSRATPSEASKTMQLFSSNPGLQQRIRSKVIENLLHEAERSPTAQDAVALRLDPNRVVNSEKLLKILGNPEKQRVYENILGTQAMKDLEMLAKVLRPVEQQQTAFAGAGGISGGMAVSGFLRGGVMGFIDKTVRHKIISTLLTMRPTRAWLENTALTGNAKDNFMLAAVSSEPFWEGLVDDYGHEGAQRIMREIGQNLGIGTPQGSRQAQQTNAPSRDRAIRQFLNAPQ